MNNIVYIKEKIRQQVKLSDLVERMTGVKIIKQKMLCPFHNEKTPSFFVNDYKGLYYCQGCGAGGDIFDFVMRYNNMSFKQSVSFIDAKFDLGLSNTHISNSERIAQYRRKQEQEKKKYIEAKKQREYDEICQDYRICNIAISVLEPLSDSWGYYINQRTYLDYLIQEGGY